MNLFNSALLIHVWYVIDFSTQCFIDLDTFKLRPHPPHMS